MGGWGGEEEEKGKGTEVQRERDEGEVEDVIHYPTFIRNWVEVEQREIRRKA